MKYLNSLFIIVLCLLSTAFADFKDWAKTPPMGWNSWDCYGPTVVESEVRANADFMAKNLKKFGWEYVVVDIRWYVENTKSGGYNQKDPNYVLDKWGRYMPAENRFPSAKNGRGFKPLADYVHSKGLKFGIHVMRGVPKTAVENKTPIKGASGITADKIASDKTICWWLKDNKTIDFGKTGAQEYYDSIISLYASWGVDFLKIDDLANPYHPEEIEMIRRAIDKCGRKIVLSVSPGETPISCAEHIKQNANMWRIVPDLWDNWGQVNRLMDAAARWVCHISDGGYPDCDMLPLGRIGIRAEVGRDRLSKLTKDEQYSLMNLMLICRSPLMFGGDLPSCDEFTMSLLTNRRALNLHKNSKNVRVLKNEGGFLVISSEKRVGDGGYIAFFNRTDVVMENIELARILESLGIAASEFREVWAGNLLKNISLNPHSSVLIDLM